MKRLRITLSQTRKSAELHDSKHQKLPVYWNYDKQSSEHTEFQAFRPRIKELNSIFSKLRNIQNKFSPLLHQFPQICEFTLEKTHFIFFPVKLLHRPKRRSIIIKKQRILFPE
ncbi:hypothetical protein NE237_027433 [Protea cynaroides]|uniref:Uncharacterized protein n=1 Tax=Protea cynaroides TaxID=273540 RepID=A0A9Q0GMI9_9MAGN|nr:hypothetical protein NE237_027433 [Protea cynaroides]